MANLKGVLPPIVTPRIQGKDEVDVGRIGPLAAHFIDAGVAGIFATGSTGEAPLLTNDQRVQVIEACVAASGGRVPVVAGVGAPATAESLLLAQEAVDAGAGYISILPTHFFPTTDDELTRYFAAVSDSVGIPAILYNFPARCGGRSIPPSVAAALAKDHNVVGIKDSSGDLANSMNYISACGKEFAVFVGSESLILPALVIGAAGTICAAANVFPSHIVAIYRAFQHEDLQTARHLQYQLQPVWREIMAVGSYPANVKAAMKLVGQAVGDPFPPVLPLTEQESARIAAAIAGLVPQ